MKQGWKFYLANIEEKPVGTCLLSSLHKTGGIFNLGTLKEYRRRGIGTALKLRALVDSTDEGNVLHTLETEKGAESERLYKEIVFEIKHSISYFAKKIIAKI